MLVCLVLSILWTCCVLQMCSQIQKTRTVRHFIAAEVQNCSYINIYTHTSTQQHCSCSEPRVIVGHTLTLLVKAISNSGRGFLPGLQHIPVGYGNFSPV